MEARTWIGVVAGLAIAGFLGACSAPAEDAGEAAPATSETAAAVAVPPAARERAAALFAERCAACHGPEGRGDGPGAAAMDPKPRNYHDPEWQQSVTDEEIEQAIVYGGAAVGKSPLMVGNPDLAGQPEVVTALREIVRNFGQQP